MKAAMSYTYTADELNELIDVRASGEASPQEIIAMYGDIEKQLNQHGYDRVLLDASALTLNYESDKVIEVTECLSSLFSWARLARLVNLADFKNDLIETFAHRNALQIKSFTERDAALRWLTAPQSPEVELSY